MKKIVILLIFILMLTGCSKEEQMTSFIPTAAPSLDAEDGNDTIGPTATPAPKTIYVGQTTTKYVKLSEYDDVLNVRSAPSTDSDIVGFLVHTEKVDVIDIVDGWASFVYNDAICYVNADYLVDEKPAYLDPPTPTPAASAKKKTGSNTTGPEI